MGVDTRRPPLPAPTESMDETSGVETEVATTLTSRTDKSSYEIPEDGSPITISTQKAKEGRIGHHGRQKSQTSLLIEYFETSKTGEKSRSRPSVRVKVTPSGAKKGRTGANDAVQITGIGADRKPSYTRRISLGSKNVETGHGPTEHTEISHSSESNVSARPPIEVEVLDHGSDLSNHQSSRGLTYAPIDSNVSSMPPDSLLESDRSIDRARMRNDPERDDDITIKDADYLKAPNRTRSRSVSRERLTQKVMEKLGASPKLRKTSRSGRERSSKDHEHEGYSREHRRRSSKTHHGEDDMVSGAESSLVSSNVAPSQRSYRSGTSQGSRMTNNPRLLEMVEDTIKRMILPEINAIKEDQRADRKLRTSTESRRDSLSKSEYERGGLDRHLSKSSSSPNISSKPKVVLNREGDDPGMVLSRGDSERVRTRKSKGERSDHRSSSHRRSSGRHSRGEIYDDEEKVYHKSKRSGHAVRDAAAAGLAGGILTAAALKHHDSQGDIAERRKRRHTPHGGRSRSESFTETSEESQIRKDAIPPMPLTSGINDSEVTRDSILSQGTERPHSAADIRTPIREVSRGSLGDAMSPSRTPLAKGLGMSRSNQSMGSPKSPGGGLSHKTRVAQLAAAGAAGAVVAKGAQSYMDADGYGETRSTRKAGSPAHSVSSLRKNFEDEDQSLIPPGLRPRSAASRSSAQSPRSRHASRASMRSADSSPTTTKLARSLQHSQNVSMDEFTTPQERPRSGFSRGDSIGTPAGETPDEWFERQHQVNDRYRHSMAESTNRDSYQTNPYPQDEKRLTMTTNDSTDLPYEGDGGDEIERDVRPVGANPEYVHTPIAVESAVASLMEPSFVSSNIVSSTGSPTKEKSSYSDRMAEHLRVANEDSPVMYEGSTLSQTMPSEDRWAGLSRQARNLSMSSEGFSPQKSPRQSPAKSLREQDVMDDKPKMSANILPGAEDPMPEIGHYDSKSELSTNPSIIKGPLGGDVTGNDTWPYTPDPQRDFADVDDELAKDRHGKTDGNLAAAAVGGGAAALLAARAASHIAAEKHEREKPILDSKKELTAADELEKDLTPTGSPAPFRDEGYVTDNRARSTGAATPKADRRDMRKDRKEFERAMEVQDAVDDDPFLAKAKHARQFSGGSHGIDSPLYDSSTGRGKENIQSKDVVALMDHLTVRDAQRNARDTEILVTLVRNAAEMRQNFDDMKRFIIEQDRMITQGTDRSGNNISQKGLGGSRPSPGGQGTPRRQGTSEEEIQTKRRGVLRRALKGLTGGKSANDLARVETMLMQILDNVEDLKHQGGGRPSPSPYTADSSLDSYEKLRAAPDPGYEPEGFAGTSSTPSQSGYLPLTPREKQQFHSGYDGRPGSANRVSTVHEDDEDELEPHEAAVLSNQFEHNEQLLTPTQETHRHRGYLPDNTPPQHKATYDSPDKQKKHKSNGSSSLFGNPKVSRWSKTTTSSAAPDPALLDSPARARNARPSSEASRSMTDLNEYDDRSSTRTRSMQDLPMESRSYVGQGEARSMRSQASRLTRTPSPLIPSEVSSKHQDPYEDEELPSPIQEDLTPEFDDPKYQAHRNSLLLQHPQPRQGNTPRHQNTLETQAHTFDDATGTNSDLSQRSLDFDPAIWGSSGTAGLARHRLSQAEPLTPDYVNGGGKRGSSDAAKTYKTREASQKESLIPEPKSAGHQGSSGGKTPRDQYYEPEPEPEDWDEPQFSNSGFSKGGYYSSPYGSGHLLEPIEEVRYSLETDSGHVSDLAPSYMLSPETRADTKQSPEPQVAQAIEMRSPIRKITGPRPMGSVSPHVSAQPKLVETTGTIRRKPVGDGSKGSRDSFDSETF